MCASFSHPVVRRLTLDVSKWIRRMYCVDDRFLLEDNVNSSEVACRAGDLVPAYPWLLKWGGSAGAAALSGSP